MALVRAAAAAVVFAVAVYSQPYIVPGGVLNAASYASAGLPGGSIARGSFFSIFGRQIGPTTAAQASSFPLGTTLAGVSIKVTQGTTSVDAIPVFVLASQINAIMPSNAPLGAVSVQVTYNNVKSNPLPVQIVNASFGIFAVNSAGTGPGILQNYVAADQQPLNDPNTSAKPGQVITLWGTGLGPVAADNVAPTPGDLATPVDISVGGKTARKLYGGRSPCCAGTDQIVFEVPADAPQGCYVPVYVRAGTVTSNVVTMAIQQDGAPCTDTMPLMQTLRQGGKRAVAALIRAEAKRYTKTPSTFAKDWAFVSMRDEPANPYAFDPYYALPPAGSCTAYNVNGNLLAGDNPIGVLSAGKALNYGTGLSLIGPGVSKQLPQGSTADLSFLPLGGKVSPQGSFALPTLEPGNYTLSGAGGADVGTLRADFSIAQPLTWTNRDTAGGYVKRSNPLTLTWTGAPAGQTVFAFGVAVDVPTNSSAFFLCTATPEAGSLTVPPAILGMLPRVRANIFQSLGLLEVGSVPNAPAAFTASGLSGGLAIPIYFTGRIARYY